MTTLTRRQFIAASTLAWVGINSTAAQSRLIIDFHLHINHCKRNLPATIAHVEGLGCEKAVFLPLDDISSGLFLTPDEVLDAYRQYPQQ